LSDKPTLEELLEVQEHFPVHTAIAIRDAIYGNFRAAADRSFVWSRESVRDLELGKMLW
jgi:hypothetical protein